MQPNIIKLLRKIKTKTCLQIIVLLYIKQYTPPLENGKQVNKNTPTTLQKYKQLKNHHKDLEKAKS